MSKYEIKTVHNTDREDTFVIYSTEESAFFAGYDFMGSVNWEKIPSHECELTKEDDPEQIVRDLESADEPASPEEDPARKQFFVQIRYDGEVFNHIMTGRELAERYETNAEAGIGESYAAYEVSDFGNPVRVNVWEIVHPIIDHKRWMQEEYDDYCNELRYADWN
jgi:hypothetical protein